MAFSFAGKKVLVTGGAGFIGSHVADRLVEEGCRVHVLDDLSGGVVENVPDAATFHELDVRSDEVPALFERERFDALCHLAAQMDVRRSVADPVFDADVNVLGFLNLLEAGRQNGLQKVAFASTGGAIYGEPDPDVNGGGPQPESHPTRPMSPYGITKLVSEHYLRFYEQTYGLPYAALRFGNVYGPRQNPHGEAGVVAIFSQRLLRGEGVTINGPGTQTRDYVFVGDVVRAFVAGLALDGSGVFNVGTGVETDVNELFGHINRHTGAGAAEQHGPAKPGEQQRSVLDVSHSREVLGWEPTVRVGDGLEQTVAWFREREAS
ncbi:NAD-dependent epimerase/dehydratase family protein [Rubrivirga litoralis]|uniref:GDP-mannose 4,6-dehydratase n=1 Tax=Rubrivirga litoralis TaxID=3075598 RepID=A0ABU3BQN3_9BACT|nr:NAD-dependent epimerase/dehydratase family protein [Rubrivirga sp. F394]MDT0631603.1 GDP-mannose 4,6-dehydratase [Rubrivirga sp. F394]